MAKDKSHEIQRPIPQRENEKLRANLSAPNITNPNNPSFPIGDISPSNKQPQKSSSTKKPINRGEITRRDDDKINDISIGLQDHDEAIAYYFNNVIQPSIVKNGLRVDVPLVYGSPERWKSVQRDGHYRDKEGKIQTPLIMFKRNSIEKRRDLGNKMDANNPQLQYAVQKQYSKRNQYDNFSVLQGRIPQKEIYNVVIPDYVKLGYTFTIWTSFIADMNKITEAINYASDSYWGDPERFKFNARIDSFNSSVETPQGENRIVKTDFDMVLQGYIVPEAMGALLKQYPKKTFSKSISTYFTETTGDGVQNDRKRHKINKVGDEGSGIGYDKIGHQQIG